MPTKSMMRATRANMGVTKPVMATRAVMTRPAVPVTRSAHTHIAFTAPIDRSIRHTPLPGSFKGISVEGTAMMADTTSISEKAGQTDASDS